MTRRKNHRRTRSVVDVFSARCPLCRGHPSRPLLLPHRWIRLPYVRLRYLAATLVPPTAVVSLSEKIASSSGRVSHLQFRYCRPPRPSLLMLRRSHCSPKTCKASNIQCAEDALLVALPDASDYAYDDYDEYGRGSPVSILCPMSFSLCIRFLRF